MAVRRAIVTIAGQLQELPSGDTLAGAGGGSATIYTAIVDFGAGEAKVVKTTIANGAVSGGSIIALCGHKADAGRPADEVEMEPLVSSVGTVGSGTFDVYTHATQGGAHGQYILSYMIG